MPKVHDMWDKIDYFQIQFIKQLGELASEYKHKISYKIRITAVKEKETEG